MKKRFLALLTTLFLLFGLYACGTKEATCDVCTFGTWTTTITATCNKEGLQKRTCTQCGNYQTQSIPTTDHQFGAWTTSVTATCKQEGVQKRTCTKCSHYETQPLPTTDHQAKNGRCSTCDKLMNAYDAFVYYVKTKGDYDDGTYSLLLGMDTTSDNITYSRHASYNVTNGELRISLLWDSDYYLSIMIERDNSTYSYGILLDDYYMLGNFYPTTFTSSTTTLYYSYTDITSSTLKTSARKMGASMASVLLLCLDEDIKDSGITAQDLRFYNF